MFLDREEAGRQLAARLKGRPLVNPLVLAVPRGGVVVGAALARELGADLDVVLVRKLRAPAQPELAIGAIAEDGEVYLNLHGLEVARRQEYYLHEECRYQMREIARRRGKFRRARPAAPVLGRSAILTDDGIATGSTMLAAVNLVRAQHPHELIVAVPVAACESLEEIRPSADEVVCLLSPPKLGAVGRFYRDFRPVDEAQALALLRATAAPGSGGPDRAHLSSKGVSP
jgi:predicted phosphoribosyltransferase